LQLDFGKLPYVVVAYFGSVEVVFEEGFHVHHGSSPYVLLRDDVS
jgi:hypothetical protein